VRVALLLLFAMLCASVQAQDATLWRGLNVRADLLRERLSVDGVAFIVTRFAGTDVPQLTERVLRSWRDQGEVVLPSRSGGWDIRSRIHAGRAESIQWRDGELLWSSADLQRPVAQVPAASIVLPSSCHWLRSVHGTAAERRYLQRTAHCNATRDSLRSLLSSELRIQGWHVRTSDAAVFAQRAQSQVQVVITTDARHSQPASSLVWLEVGGVERP
jgi:hypothetical protein